MHRLFTHYPYPTKCPDHIDMNDGIIYTISRIQARGCFHWEISCLQLLNSVVNYLNSLKLKNAKMQLIKERRNEEAFIIVVFSN